MLCNVDCVWAAHCMPLVEVKAERRSFQYLGSWKRTYMLLKRPGGALPAPAPPLAVVDFKSPYLYLQWLRSNMDLSAFEPEVQEVPRLPVDSLSYSRFVRCGRGSRLSCRRHRASCFIAAPCVRVSVCLCVCVRVLFQGV